MPSAYTWFSDFVHESVRRTRSEGPTTGVKYSLHTAYHGAILRGLLNTSAFDPVNIYDREWDVLLVLDACRYDMMEAVSEDNGYEFITEVERVDSVAPQTNM